MPRVGGAPCYSRYDASEARAGLDAREREYVRSLEWCRCPRPLLASAYGDRMGCRLCSKLTDIPARLSIIERVEEPAREAA